MDSKRGESTLLVDSIRVKWLALCQVSRGHWAGLHSFYIVRFVCKPKTREILECWWCPCHFTAVSLCLFGTWVCYPTPYNTSIGINAAFEALMLLASL